MCHAARRAIRPPGGGPCAPSRAAGLTLLALPGQKAPTGVDRGPAPATTEREGLRRTGGVSTRGSFLWTVVSAALSSLRSLEVRTPAPSPGSITRGAATASHRTMNLEPGRAIPGPSPTGRAGAVPAVLRPLARAAVRSSYRRRAVWGRNSRIRCRPFLCGVPTPTRRGHPGQATLMSRARGPR